MKPDTRANIASCKDGGRLMSMDALRGFDMFWIVGAGALIPMWARGRAVCFSSWSS